MNISLIEWLEIKYNKWPKWIRFGIYYGTSPLWIPIGVTVCLAALVFIYPVVLICEAWEDFK